VGTKIEGAAEKTFAATSLKKIVPAVIETTIDAGRRSVESEQPKPQPKPLTGKKESCPQCV
jgi:hypothetical protein